MRYELKVIDKFLVPNLTKKVDHSILDGYTVSFAVSDSVIYTVDTTDSTQIRSYSYRFDGEQLNGFKLPAKTGYWQPLIENCFYYLLVSKQIAYLNVRKLNLDFFNLQDNFIQRIHKHDKDKEYYLDIAEHNNTRYFVSISYQESLNDNVIKLNLYAEQSGEHPALIHSISHKNRQNEFGVTTKLLQLDNYNGESMAILEDKPGKCKVTMYVSDKGEVAVVK